jgi:hypothetical protein
MIDVFSQEFSQKVNIYKLCKQNNIEVPKEVSDFFNGRDPDDIINEHRSQDEIQLQFLVDAAVQAIDEVEQFAKSRKLYATIYAGGRSLMIDGSDESYHNSWYSSSDEC